MTWPMTQILLVEDDRDLALSIIDHLELEGMACDYAANGLQGKSLLSENEYSAVIMDVNMPGMDGMALCNHLRETGNDVSVIMLTARDTLADKVQGFGNGADDYLVKPFEVDELLVRVKAISKRRSGQVQRLKQGVLELDISRRSTFIDGQKLAITPTGFKILECLLRNHSRLVTQDQLCHAVWGDETPDSNSLRVHIYNLRKTLAKHDLDGSLHTIAGEGFYLDIKET